MPNLNDAKAAITRPIGPLPAWGWVAVVVGGYFAYKFISGRSGSSTSTTAATGTAVPTDGTTGSLDSLTQSIQDLLSKLSNTGGGGGGTTVPPVTPPGDSSGGGGGSSSGGGGSTTSTNPVSSTPVGIAKNAGNLLANITENGKQAVAAAAPIETVGKVLDENGNPAAGAVKKAVGSVTSSAQQIAPIAVASPGTTSNTVKQELTGNISGAVAGVPTSLSGGDLTSLQPIQQGVGTIAGSVKLPATTTSIAAQTPKKLSTGLGSKSSMLAK